MRKCILQYTVKYFYGLLTLDLRSFKFTLPDSTPPVDIGTPDWENQPLKLPNCLPAGRQGGLRGMLIAVWRKTKV